MKKLNYYKYTFSFTIAATVLNQCDRCDLEKNETRTFSVTKINMFDEILALLI